MLVFFTRWLPSTWRHVQINLPLLSFSLLNIHECKDTPSKISSAKGIYLLWFELHMWVLWGINSSMWNGGRCRCLSRRDWVMSKAFNGEERRRRGLKFPLHITYPASSSSFFTSLNLSFQLCFDLCFYLRYRFLICALHFPFSSPPSCLVFFPPPFLSLISYWHHSLPVW